MTSDPGERELDVLVIGAGLAGLAALHRLRELGFTVRGYDVAGDVGGTWWWHYYPGARLDTEAPVYQYLFSRALYEEWGWSERYPAGYEVQRWLRFVADRLDLRRDLELGTRIVHAHWDDERGRWTARTDRGERIDTRFVVACTGLLPAARAELPGAFAGLSMDTAHWPERHPALRGRRVGVIGAGTVAVQLVERVAAEVAHLSVFAPRLPLVLPRSNPHYGWQERAAYRARFDELAVTVPWTRTGDDHDARHAWTDHTTAGREAVLAEAVRDGSQDPLRATFHEVGVDPAVTAAVTASLRRVMRERLADRALADLVVPDEYDVATRPVPLQSGYLEALAAEHVEVRTAPVTRLRDEGVELADGTVHELDVVARTDEFDAGPPAVTRTDVRGSDGRRLTARQGWTLGMAARGFPNLLATAMPTGPLRTRSTVLQIQVSWICDAVARLRQGSGERLEPSREGERAWLALVEERAGAGPADGAGGVGDYHRRCAEEAAAGYPSFDRT